MPKRMHCTVKSFVVVLVTAGIVIMVNIVLHTYQVHLYHRKSSETNNIRYEEYISKEIEVERKLQYKMKSRRDRMEDTCTKYGLNKNNSYDVVYIKNPFLKTALFYSDKYKLVMCAIPKCGSRSLMQFLVTIEGLVEETDPGKVPDWKATSLAEKERSARRISTLEEMTKRLSTYRKLILVREPFSRLLSAFRNKIENNNREDGYTRVARKVHDMYKNKDVVEDDKPVTRTTLQEFLQYISDSKNEAQGDQHWNFYNRLCSPCDIKYDYIAHVEDVNEDMKFVMDELGITNITFPPSFNTFTDTTKVNDYYGSIDFAVLKALYGTYKLDFDLFDYAVPLTLS